MFRGVCTWSLRAVMSTATSISPVKTVEASSSVKPLLTFVTGNPRKLEEVEAIVGDSFPWKLVNKDVDLPELQGEPLDIATAKCKIAATAINGPVIIEDTCLCFNALKGLPGPYIKWFLKKIGHDGLNNLLAAYEDKSGYTQCTFAYSPGAGEDILLFIGKTKGTIVPARGPPNFGWDPIFQPDGFDKTYAELDSAVKNTISHRYKALVALRDHFIRINEESQLPPEKKPRTED